MIKYFVLQSEERLGAARDLERIRVLMERAGRYSHLSAAACFVAGALALAGGAACRHWRVDFDPDGYCGNPPGAGVTLLRVWGAVFLLALGQMIAFTVLNARRRGEPAWSALTRQVVVAMLPAGFVGAAVTGWGVTECRFDLLPPIWMMAYGSSVMGVGLFADWRVKLVAVLFLALGAVTLFWARPHGLLMMAASFGGLHLLLGTLLLWKPRKSPA